MTENDFKAAGEYVSENETELKSGNLLQEAKSALHLRIKDLSESTRWSFEILSMAFSHSDCYLFIGRARVLWSFDGETALSVEVVCKGNKGEVGIGSFVKDHPTRT